MNKFNTLGASEISEIQLILKVIGLRKDFYKQKTFMENNSKHTNIVNTVYYVSFIEYCNTMLSKQKLLFSHFPGPFENGWEYKNGHITRKILDLALIKSFPKRFEGTPEPLILGRIEAKYKVVVKTKPGKKVRNTLSSAKAIPLFEIDDNLDPFAEPNRGLWQEEYERLRQIDIERNHRVLGPPCMIIRKPSRE